MSGDQIPTHAEWARQSGRHCAVCGVSWPTGWHRACKSCKAGLSCRADTTCPVSPDPPCMGYRLAVLEAEAER